ncbi:MAG: ABC transporter substrate-binding protein [Gemmatimonadetes bacterium]|nr:ABC transporter substrate-binding protein [Gemmatimonadota bacterium]
MDRAVAALQRAEARYDDGEYEAASTRADSLYASWQDRSSLGALAERALLLAGRAYEAQGLPGRAADRYETLIDRARDGTFRDQAVDRFVSVLADTGREPEAVQTVLENPGALRDDALEPYRRWVSTLPLARLEGFARNFEPESIEASIVHTQLAQLLVAEGRIDEGRSAARAVLDGGPAPVEREIADLLASVEGDLRATTAKIGAILPLTGELSGVGELLREGIELAVESYRDARPDGYDIELVLLDDASNPETTAELVRELEREGVVAIVGPLRAESFASAARARRNPRLPIISPTAPEVFRPMPGAFSLYDLRTRELDVAVDLARWTVEELGLRRVAILEPTGGGTAAAVARFSDAIAGAGGEIVARASYDPSETTYQEPIESLALSSPDVVFAPAPSPQVVLSLAPQLFYYGLHDSVILGSETWADPVVLRRLEPFAADFRVVGLWLDRISGGTRWERFVSDYERTYRKSLRDNVLPGLAYDAAALVIAALERASVPLPAALDAFLAAGPQIDGVTGALRPDPETSTVRRTTHVRMLQGGALMDVDRDALLDWLAEARAAPPPFEREPFER